MDLRLHNRKPAMFVISESIFSWQKYLQDWISYLKYYPDTEMFSRNLLIYAMFQLQNKPSQAHSNCLSRNCVFECINSLRCYELTRRCSHLLLYIDITIDLPLVSILWMCSDHSRYVTSFFPDYNKLKSLLSSCFKLHDVTHALPDSQYMTHLTVIAMTVTSYRDSQRIQWLIIPIVWNPSCFELRKGVNSCPSAIHVQCSIQALTMGTTSFFIVRITSVT